MRLREPVFRLCLIRPGLVLSAVVLGAGLWGCQGPETFLRSNLAGTGGATIDEGTGGARGTGGVVMGTGGRIAGTGGVVAGTGGKIGGTGGVGAGTGGKIAGTGGGVAGTGGAVDAGTGTGGMMDVDAGGDAGAVDAGPPCTSCLEVQVLCFPDNTDTQVLKFKIQLVNKTTTPISYPSVTVRYWFKLDQPSQVPTFTSFYDAPFAPSTVTGMVGTAGSRLYLEIGFKAMATLAAGASSGEIQAQLNAHDPGWNVSQADDYSFNMNATTFTTSDHVTAYMGGALIWGTEPP